MAGYGQTNHASVKEPTHLKGLSSKHTSDHLHTSLASLLPSRSLGNTNELLNLLSDLQYAVWSLKQTLSNSK